MSTSNKYTLQPPVAGASIKTVLAERVYMAASNTAYSDPSAKLDGADPVGWTDLGIVQGSMVQFTYTKEIKYIETGIEKVRRGAYTMGKTAQCVFTLEQYDIDALALLTGQSITSITGGGKIQIGNDDVIEKALLFVGTNKIDGKEHQLYCSKGVIAWNIEQADDARVIKVTADLYQSSTPGAGFATLFVLD